MPRIVDTSVCETVLFVVVASGCANLFESRGGVFTNFRVGIILGEPFEFGNGAHRSVFHIAEVKGGQATNFEIGILEAFDLRLRIEPGSLVWINCLRRRILAADND